jgi:hypothetical protein
MFPLFHITPFIEVHLFGIFLVSAWIVFFWLLHKYSLEHGLSKNIFGDIVSYTLSIFFVGRLFYMLSDWRNEKYLFIELTEGGWVIDFLKGFFITENYELSLAWWIIWFLIVFIWKIYRTRVHIGKSIDILTRSFFWAAIIGYIGSLLGWQIYGIAFDSIVSLQYMDKNSIVPIWSARFPLPIVYILLSLGGAILIEKLYKDISVPDGFIGYIGIGYYGIILFLFEFLSGSADMFESYPPYIGINQIIWLWCIIFSLIWIIKNTKF